MKGSHTLLFIGLGSALLLFWAMKRGTGGVTGGTRDPGRAATAGTTGAAAPAQKTKKVDPLKALTETAKAEGTKAGQAAITNWFAGFGAP